MRNYRQNCSLKNLFVPINITSVYSSGFFPSNVDIRTWGRGNLLSFLVFNFLVVFFPMWILQKNFSFKMPQKRWFQSLYCFTMQWDPPAPWLRPLTFLVPWGPAGDWTFTILKEKAEGMSQAGGSPEHTVTALWASDSKLWHTWLPMLVQGNSLIWWLHSSSAEVYVLCIFTQYPGVYVRQTKNTWGLLPRYKLESVQ